MAIVLVMSQGRRYDGLPTEGDFQMMQFEKYAVLLSTQSPLDADNRNAKALPFMSLIENPYTLTRRRTFVACVAAFYGLVVDAVGDTSRFRQSSG